MALKVWLPLNKNTRNVGLANVNVTNNGAVLTTGGIYTNCYSFNGVDNNLSFTPQVDGLSSISISLWLCPSSASFSGAFFSLERETYWQITIQGTNFHIRDNSVGYNGSRKSFSIGNFNANTWTHFAAVYDNGVLKIYRDGILLSTNSVGGTKLNTGINNGRIGSAVQSGYYFNGKINDVRIYDHALSESDVLRIYNNRSTFEIPYSRETEKPEYPLWLKLLHHNAPANQLFTTTNYKKNTSNNLYSRCGWMFGNTIFKLDNNTYEFLAKEKMESGSTEQTYRWTQTSSPTASTITGFNKITNTSNSSYLVGLKHNGNYSAFHNGGSWWCACGSYSAYQGGTPGFQGIVKTGYMDLWVRAEIKHLPNDYEELEYIQSTGTQYIDTNVKISTSNVKYNIKFQMTTASSSFCPFGTEYNNGSSNVRWGGLFYGYNKAGLYIGTQSHGGKWTFTTNTDYNLSLDINNGNFTTTLNGSSISGTYNGQIINDLNVTVGLFCLNRINNNNVVTRGGYASSTKMKLYHFEIIESGIVKFNGIPARRKSDNVIGLYDLASHKFFTNVGSGSFTGA